MIRRRCRKFIWRLDMLTHCRIRWVCDAADRAMLRCSRVNIDSLPSEAPHLRQMVIETRRTRNIERPTP